MATNIKNPVDITRLPVSNEECTFEGWTVKYQKSHILSSKCTNNNSCSEESSEECLFCRFSRELHLPHLPDMVFPKNELSLRHASNVVLAFNALDALKHVRSGKMDIKIACAEAWKESRTSGVRSCVLAETLAAAQSASSYVQVTIVPGVVRPYSLV